MRALLLLILLTTSAGAQERTAVIVEVLPDDQYIVRIGESNYRAINADKVVEIAKGKLELVACKENEKRFTDLIEISRRDVTIANQRAEIERGNFVRAMSLFEKERELRQEAMSLGPVSGTPKGFGGWLLRAVNSPYGAVAFRLVIPTAQAIKVFTTK